MLKPATRARLQRHENLGQLGSGGVVEVIEATGIEQTVDAPPDVDSHIPIWRVDESTRVLRDLGATVTERVYPRVRTQLSRRAMPTKTASGRAFALR
jgi:hypothetical protein